MKIEIRQSFQKDLKRIDNKIIKNKILNYLSTLEKYNNIIEIPNVKSLIGFQNYYRIRLGVFRIGLQYINDKLILERILLRKDIYKNYP